MTVLIHYRHSLFSNSMLQFCLRSICENYQDRFNLVIIGDCPSWVVNADWVMYNVGGSRDNVHEMMLSLSADKRVSESFLLMEENQVFLSSVTRMYFNRPTALCNAIENPMTDLRLRHEGYKNRMLFDYESHSPALILKSKALAILESIVSYPSWGFLTDYFNFWYSGIPRFSYQNTVRFFGYEGVFSKSSDDVMYIEQCMRNRLFLAAGPEGLTDELQAVLRKRFPNKCIFER